MLRKVLILLYILTLLITRFWNVSTTARFTRDESYDIVKLHQYWKERTITLVGAIDYTGQLVYSSLTYYTMMPFAVAGNFEPVSPVYAFSVAGVVTVTFIYLITKKIDKKKTWLVLILALVWFPLLQASRWSWNPYFLPFSMSIAIYFFLKVVGVFSTTLDKITKSSLKFKEKTFLFLSGIFFGAAFHYHYISFVASGVFMFLYGFYDYIRNKRFLVFWILLGFILMIIPFLIFDLRHPPGLFFTGYLKSNMVSQGFSVEIGRLLMSFPKIIYKMGIYFSGNRVFSFIIITISLLILIYDLKKKYLTPFIFLIPIIFQILIISFLPSFETRYFLPAIIFFLVWLLIKRKGIGDRLSRYTFAVMIFGNVLILPRTIFTETQPSPKVVGQVSNYIVEKVEKDNLKNINLAVLASPDPDPLGAVYRDVLLSKELRLLTASEFNLTDNLFIISTSDENTVRGDPANVINNFRKGIVEETYQLGNSKWKVYLFKKY